ncbi:MAG TPA: carbonic anhydrase [Kofleriaceae bacterium]|jgi:carbonic anhydrase
MPIANPADVVPSLSARNAAFAATKHLPQLQLFPSSRTIIIGCVDPRVDPADLFGLDQGEAAILRNVGGRVTPGVIDELVMLRDVSRSSGGDMGPALNLVVLHHTDCGIKRIADKSSLATFFRVDEAHVDELGIMDPRASVAIDIAALRASKLPNVLVSGLVYDVATGRIEVVAPPALLHA